MIAMQIEKGRLVISCTFYFNNFLNACLIFQKIFIYNTHFVYPRFRWSLKLQMLGPIMNFIPWLVPYVPFGYLFKK